MKEQKKLTLGMTIFSLLVFVCFGIIIVTEKTAPYFSPRIDKKLNEYLKENYNSIINEFKIGNTNYENTIYQLKITSTENKDLYFYLKYANKKITDTYQEDYKEGKSLLTKISTSLENELAKKYNKEFSITVLTTLDKFSEQVREKIIQEEQISSLPIYSLDTKIQTTFTNQNISNEIKALYHQLTVDNIIPKSYNLTIIDKNKENKSIKINNLTKEIIENNEVLSTVINDILSGKNSNILKQNNITYEQIKEWNLCKNAYFVK